MKRKNLPPESESALAAYRLPSLSFSERSNLSDEIRAFWDALGGEASPAVLASEVTEVLQNASHGLRAPLYLILAVCHLRTARYDRAVTAARQSILFHPAQHASHRVLLEVFWEQRAYDDAYFYLSTVATPTEVEPWDELLAERDRHNALAALAWRVQDWSGVIEHLALGYPSGPDEMPISLREDLLRVSVYRGSAKEAARVASSLLTVYDVNGIDLMLRILDSRGWSAHALELYRTAFASHPNSSLLRRRLVGLCIREGHLEEARSLAEGMPLDLAA